MPEKIILRNTQSPGDYVVLSAAVRDLSRAHPGRFEFMMDVPQPAVFQANPHITVYPKTKGRQIVAKYPLIHKSNQTKVHFMWGFIEYLNEQLGTKAVLTEFRPDLHLTEEEKKSPPAGVKKPYWLFVSGGKRDFTAKWWDPVWWQVVVDAMYKRVTMVQTGGGSHVHPRLNNVQDLVAKSSFRDLMRMIYHSEGVLCIVTCLMHIAAAFNKPCVVVAGGREPWWWEAYTEDNRIVNMQRGIPDWSVPADDTFIPHQYLHTMGELDCCKTKGCWKARVEGNGSVCARPVYQNNRNIPQCLQLITPEKVINAVEWYYKQGILEWGKGSTTVPLFVEPRLIPEPVNPPELVISKDPTDLWKSTREKGLVVWLDDSFAPEAGWESRLRDRVGCKKVGGIVYACRQPVDAATPCTYYSKGVIALDASLLKEGVLPRPDGKSDWPITFGKALKQYGVTWVDIGDLVRYR